MYAMFSPDFAQGGYWLNKMADTQTLGDNANDDVAKVVWDHTKDVAQI